jgi:hypothetical protein
VVSVTPRALYPQETSPVPIEQEAEWVPAPVGMFWRGDLIPLKRCEFRAAQPVAWVGITGIFSVLFNPLKTKRNLLYIKTLRTAQ